MMIAIVSRLDPSTSGFILPCESNAQGSLIIHHPECSCGAASPTYGRHRPRLGEFSAASSGAPAPALALVPTPALEYQQSHEYWSTRTRTSTGAPAVAAAPVYQTTQRIPLSISLLCTECIAKARSILHTHWLSTRISKVSSNTNKSEAWSPWRRSSEPQRLFTRC
jgi:hypothetical protein